MSEVTVVLEVNEVSITKASTTLELTAPGPQGPRGPAGPSGAAGGSVYEYEQTVPSASWIVDHNLGRKVHVSVFDSSGRLVLTDVEHGTLNRATIMWSSPTTGSAVIS